MTQLTRAAELYARALQVIPGGVSSPVRAMKAVGLEEPLFAARGEGAYLEDTEGRRYVDWVLSWGPLIFGHAYPQTVEAVISAARDGTTFGTATEREVELAEEIVDAVPSVEMVRLVSSGTEAAMTALRLARAATGREPFVRFAGCYHGHADPFLSEAGSGVRTLGIQASGEGRVVPYNDLSALERVLTANEGEVAAFILEPVMENIGIALPDPGYLEGIREVTKRHGTMLIFDEVKTGITAGYGPNGTLLWEGHSPLATVWAEALPDGNVCATGGYDALITCWRVPRLGPSDTVQ